MDVRLAIKSTEAKRKLPEDYSFAKLNQSTLNRGWSDWCNCPPESSTIER